MNDLHEMKKYLLSKSIPLWVILLSCIALLSLFLSLFHFSGYYASDDNSYLSGIQAVVGLKQISSSWLGAIRLGVTAPGALVYWLSDGNTFITILHYVIYPVFLVLLAYKIAKIVFGPEVALLASFLVAINPIYYFYAGAVLPDNLLTFWAGVSLLLLIKSLQIDVKASSKRKTIVMYLLLGISVGLGYMTKESELILIVPILILIVFSQRTIVSWHVVRSSFALVLGILIIIVLETYILYALTGEWSLRLLVSQNNESVDAYLTRMSTQGVYPIERFLFLCKVMWPFLGWLFPIMLGVLVIYPIVGPRSREGWQRSACWAIYFFYAWSGIYLTFGTANFSHYLPPSIQQRYYAQVFFPGMILMADLLILFLRKLLSRIHFRFQTAAKYIFGFMIILIITFWGMERFLYLSEDSGSVYRAYDTKSFLECYRDALNYTDQNLTIVLSSYSSTIFSPLFLNTKHKNRLYFTPSGDELTLSEAPKPPFLFIAPVNDKYPDRTRSYLNSLLDKGIISISHIIKETYGTPRGRINELKYYLYPVMSNFDPPEIDFSWKSRRFQLLYIAPIGKHNAKIQKESEEIYFSK